MIYPAAPEKDKSELAKSGEQGARNTSAPMADHQFLDIPSNGALGIVEMQIQFATGCVTSLLSAPAGQRHNYVVNKVYRCERRVLEQQVHHDEFLRVERNHQH
jgi:hypothetical protein